MCALLVGLPDVASYSRGRRQADRPTDRPTDFGATRHPGEVGVEAGRPGGGVRVERPAVDLLAR
jgi:hypothetical protein